MISFILAFFIVAAFLILILAVIVPLSVSFFANVHNVGIEIMQDNYELLQNIPEVNETLMQAIQANKENIELFTLFWKFSPYIFIIVLIVVFFMWARRTVEYPSMV